MMYNAYVVRDNYGEVKLLKKGETPPNDGNNYYPISDDTFFLRNHKTKSKFPA